MGENEKLTKIHTKNVKKITNVINAKKGELTNTVTFRDFLSDNKNIV